MSIIKCAECGEKVSNYANSCPHCGFVNPADFFAEDVGIDQKTDSQLLWDTVATAGKIAMVACLVIGGCIYIGGTDNRPALQKAMDERDKNCSLAKQSGNLKNVSHYCN
jgi:hypothetical protein